MSEPAGSDASEQHPPDVYTDERPIYEAGGGHSEAEVRHWCRDNKLRRRDTREFVAWVMEYCNTPDTLEYEDDLDTLWWQFLS
jgi:hypothetical protein